MNNNKKALILAAVIFVLAVAITVYPLVSNFLAEKYRSEVESEYFEAVEHLKDEEVTAAMDAAREYNSLLSKGVMQTNFTGESLNAALNGYDELLNLNGNGIMAYIDIPVLDIYLPVSHGTEAETLENSVGHVIGSSLPVGGEGTHAVLSGHSGLATQKMFSDLEALTEGSLFYIHVLNETLAYEVSEMNVVEPEDTSLLAIEEGKDSVTLVTCTPFGVNTHRLLVRGERAPFEAAAEDIQVATLETETASTWTEQYVKGLLIGLIMLALLIVVFILVEKKLKGDCR